MAGCAVTGNTLDFGQTPGVDALVSVTAAQRPQTTINVLCTKGVAYQVGISDGANVSAGQRRMNNETDYINYELYKSLTGSDRFGDTDTTQRVSGTSTGVSVGVPVYGQIVSGAIVGAGQYLDTATITVYFRSQVMPRRISHGVLLTALVVLTAPAVRAAESSLVTSNTRLDFDAVDNVQAITISKAMRRSACRRGSCAGTTAASPTSTARPGISDSVLRCSLWRRKEIR
jgi:spore coat protein U-like protein